MFLQDKKIIDITPQQLIQKVNHHQVFNKMFNFSKQRRLAQARSQYNLESRDINKFIRQIREINAKLKQQDKQNQTISHKGNKKTNRRYDQNQLKQFQYNQFDKIRVKTSADSSFKVNQKQKSIIAQTPSTLLDPFSRLKKKKSFLWDSSNYKSLINSQSSKFKKMNTIQRSSQILQDNFDSSLRLKLNRKVSTLSPRKFTTPSTKSNIQYINISNKNKQHYIKHLKQLLYGHNDQYQLPDDSLLNQKVIQRYKIINISASEQNQQKIFSLPLCDFSNRKGVDQSIRQFINMHPDKAQRIAFQIYDRNKNGVIDQKDLLQLIGLSEQIPLIGQDLHLIIKSLNIDDQYLQKIKLKNLGDQEFSNNRTKTTQRLSDYFPSPLSPLKQKQSINRKKLKTIQYCGSSSFQKNKFYSMLSSRSQFFKVKNRLNLQKANTCIKWKQFKKIFGNQKPAIFYDLIKFIFNCQTPNFTFPKVSKIKNSSRRQQSQKSINIKIQNILEVMKTIQHQQIKVQLH